MDIVTHAVVGAATGLPFGRPLMGALIACVPDVVLGWRRKPVPNDLYNLTHGLPFLALNAFVLWILFSPELAVLVALALASHVVLDLPTHGATWAPPLLYPFHTKRYSMGNEWEFFNESWVTGFLVAVLWSLICVLIVVAQW